MPLVLLLAGPPTAQAVPALAPDSAAVKVDPAVLAAIQSAGSAQVIVLGQRQLLEPVTGLAEFSTRHQSTDRRLLRPRVVAELKRIATREQRKLLRRLNIVDSVKSLWIVNGFLARLSAQQVRLASTLPEVRFIYPAEERLAPAQSPGRFPVVRQPVNPPPFSDRGKRIAWNVDSLNAPRVWRELDLAGEGVVVASLDVGVNYLHRDLRDHLWVNREEIPGNGRDDDGNGYVDDLYGYDFGGMTPDIRDTSAVVQHGTITAGIMLGNGTAGTITGVAPAARLMILRGGGMLASALAFQYALEHGADVLNMSFSLPGLGNVRGLWRMMSDHAVAAGLLLIGGAGNFRTTASIPTQHQTPKDVPSVISVGGVDSVLTLAPFSSGGPAEWGSVALYGDYPMPGGLIKPDVVAFPGAGYPVLAPNDSGYVEPNRAIRGNSLSGPQGAGVAALILAGVPALPVWRVKAIMEETARDLGPAGKDNDFGAGLLDAYAAVLRGLGYNAEGDTLHGTIVRDPYRWLEDPRTDRTKRWIAAQDSVTRAYLRSDNRYARVRGRLAELQIRSGIRLPAEAAGRLFFFGAPPGGETRPAAGPNLYAQSGLGGAPIPLIADPDFRFDLVLDLRPSPTGRHVAVGSRAAPGSSWMTWRILEVESRAFLPERLEGAFLLEDLAWSADGTAVYYGRFDLPSDSADVAALRRGHRVVVHRLGSPMAHDSVLLAVGTSAERELSINTTADGRWLVVVGRQTADLSSRVDLIPLREPGPPLRLVDDVPGIVRFLGTRDGGFLFFTTAGAARGRAISVRAGNLPHQWRTLVPEGPDAILAGGQGQAAPVVVGDHLVIPYQRDLQVRLALVDLRNRNTRVVTVPEGGLLFNSSGGNPLAGAPGLNSLFFQFIGITEPIAIFRVDLASGGVSIFSRPKLPFEPGDYETIRVFYPSGDGTRIPMSITRRKGAPADGSRPTVLHAYGADGFVMMPFYRPWFMAWLELGGSFAIANVRGGGEYGATWHEAAIGPTKGKTLDDYVAAAEWLVEQGHAARGKVVGNAVSAGGFLPAMLAIRRPDLVGAALIDYPILDLVRYERFAGGGFRDFGTTADRATFETLLSISPYARLEDRRCYPPMLVLTSETDDQAPPLHAYKFLARAQAMQRCRRPLLLNLVRGSGHSTYGSRSYPVLDAMTDQLVFLLKALDPG